MNNISLNLQSHLRQVVEASHLHHKEGVNIKRLEGKKVRLHWVVGLEPATHLDQTRITYLLF